MTTFIRIIVNKNHKTIKKKLSPLIYFHEKTQSYSEKKRKYLLTDRLNSTTRNVCLL